MAIPAYYGSFNFNDGINFFVLGKDNLSFTEIKPTYQKMGRLEGMKKTGETVNEKTIVVEIMVIGTSRADLENHLDTLYAALNVRGQALSLHANDQRYYIADGVKCDIKLQKGDILSAKGSITFIAPLPYAYSQTTSSSDTGTLTYPLMSGSVYNLTPYAIVGGGNVFSRPSIHIVKQQANTVTWSAISLVQSTDSQTLNVSSNFPVNNGDYIDIYCDPLSATGFQVILNNTTQCAFNGIFPVMEPGSTTWDVQITAAGGAPIVDVVWNWTPRWLS